MRIFAVIVLGVFCLFSTGCNVMLQPSQQGDWAGSNFQKQKYKVSQEPERDAEHAEK